MTIGGDNTGIVNLGDNVTIETGDTFVVGDIIIDGKKIDPDNITININVTYVYPPGGGEEPDKPKIDIEVVDTDGQPPVPEDLWPRIASHISEDQATQWEHAPRAKTRVGRDKSRQKDWIDEVFGLTSEDTEVGGAGDETKDAFGQTKAYSEMTPEQLDARFEKIKFETDKLLERSKTEPLSENEQAKLWLGLKGQRQILHINRERSHLTDEKRAIAEGRGYQTKPGKYMSKADGTYPPSRASQWKYRTALERHAAAGGSEISEIDEDELVHWHREIGTHAGSNFDGRPGFDASSSPYEKGKLREKANFITSADAPTEADDASVPSPATVAPSTGGTPDVNAPDSAAPPTGSTSKKPRKPKVTAKTDPKEWGKKQRDFVLEWQAGEFGEYLNGDSPIDQRESFGVLSGSFDEDNMSRLIRRSYEVRKQWMEGGERPENSSPNQVSPFVDEEITKVIAPMLRLLDETQTSEDIEIHYAVPSELVSDVGAGEIMEVAGLTRGKIIDADSSIDMGSGELSASTRIKIIVPAGSRGMPDKNSHNGDIDDMILPPGSFVIVDVDSDGTVIAIPHYQKSAPEVLETMLQDIRSLPAPENDLERLERERIAVAITDARSAKPASGRVSNRDDKIPLPPMPEGTSVPEYSSDSSRSQRGVSKTAIQQNRMKSRNIDALNSQKKSGSQPFAQNESFVSLSTISPEYEKIGMYISPVEVQSRQKQIDSAVANITEYSSQLKKLIENPDADFIELKDSVPPDVFEFVSKATPEELNNIVSSTLFDFHKGFDDRVHVPIQVSGFDDVMKFGRVRPITEINPDSNVSRMRSARELSIGISPIAESRARTVDGYLRHTSHQDAIQQHLDSLPPSAVKRNVNNFLDTEEFSPFGDIRKGDASIDLVLFPEVSSRSGYVRGDFMRSGNIPTPILSESMDDVSAAHMSLSDLGPSDRNAKLKQIFDVVDSNLTGKNSKLFSSSSSRGKLQSDKFDAVIPNGVDFDEVSEIKIPNRILDTSKFTLSIDEIGGVDMLKENGFSPKDRELLLAKINSGEIKLNNAKWLVEHRAAKEWQDGFRQRFGSTTALTFTNPDGVDVLDRESFSDYPGIQNSENIEQVLQKRIAAEIAMNAQKLLKDARTNKEVPKKINRYVSPNSGMPDSSRSMRPIGSDLPFDLRTGEPRRMLDETDEQWAARQVPLLDLSKFNLPKPDKNTSGSRSRREVTRSLNRVGDRYKNLTTDEIKDLVDSSIPKSEEELLDVLKSNPYTEKYSKQLVKRILDAEPDYESNKIIQQRLFDEIDNNEGLAALTRLFGIPPMMVTKYAADSRGVGSISTRLGELLNELRDREKFGTLNTSQWLTTVGGQYHYAGFIHINPEEVEDRYGSLNELLRHELSHGFNYMAAKQNDLAGKTVGELFDRQEKLTDVEMISAKKISDYATTDTAEWFAEAFSHLTSGQKDEIDKVDELSIQHVATNLGMDVEEFKKLMNIGADSTEISSSRSQRSSSPTRTVLKERTKKGAGIAGRLLTSKRAKKLLERMGVSEEDAEATQFIGELASGFAVGGPGGLAALFGRRVGRDVADVGLREAVKRGWLSPDQAQRIEKQLLDRVAPEGLPDRLSDAIEKGAQVATSDAAREKARDIADAAKEFVSENERLQKVKDRLGELGGSLRERIGIGNSSSRSQRSSRTISPDGPTVEVGTRPGAVPASPRVQVGTRPGAAPKSSRVLNVVEQRSRYLEAENNRLAKEKRDALKNRPEGVSNEDWKKYKEYVNSLENSFGFGGNDNFAFVESYDAWAEQRNMLETDEEWNARSQRNQARKASISAPDAAGPPDASDVVDTPDADTPRKPRKPRTPRTPAKPASGSRDVTVSGDNEGIINLGDDVTVNSSPRVQIGKREKIGANRIDTSSTVQPNAEKIHNDAVRTTMDALDGVDLNSLSENELQSRFGITRRGEKSLIDDEYIYHTTDTATAIAMLSRGYNVEVDDDGVAAEVSDSQSTFRKMIEENIKKLENLSDDEKTALLDELTVDLCKLYVAGKNLMCGENIGIDREQMPQLSGRAIGDDTLGVRAAKNGDIPIKWAAINEKKLTPEQTARFKELEAKHAAPGKEETFGPGEKEEFYSMVDWNNSEINIINEFEKSLEKSLSPVDKDGNPTPAIILKTARPEKYKASQRQLVGHKTDEMRDGIRENLTKFDSHAESLGLKKGTQGYRELRAKWLSGEYKFADSNGSKVKAWWTDPLLATRDGYVLDGHHRWAAIKLINEELPEDEKLDLQWKEVQTNVVEALTLGKAFQDKWGIKQAKLKGEDRFIKNDKTPGIEPGEIAREMDDYHSKLGDTLNELHSNNQFIRKESVGARKNVDVASATLEASERGKEWEARESGVSGVEPQPDSPPSTLRDFSIEPARGAGPFAAPVDGPEIFSGRVTKRVTGKEVSDARSEMYKARNAVFSPYGQPDEGTPEYVNYFMKHFDTLNNNLEVLYENLLDIEDTRDENGKLTPSQQSKLKTIRKDIAYYESARGLALRKLKDKISSEDYDGLEKSVTTRATNSAPDKEFGNPVSRTKLVKYGDLKPLLASSDDELLPTTPPDDWAPDLTDPVKRDTSWQKIRLEHASKHQLTKVDGKLDARHLSNGESGPGYQSLHAQQAIIDMKDGESILVQNLPVGDENHSPYGIVTKHNGRAIYSDLSEENFKALDSKTISTDNLPDSVTTYIKAIDTLKQQVSGTRLKNVDFTAVYILDRSATKEMNGKIYNIGGFVISFNPLAPESQGTLTLNGLDMPGHESLVRHEWGHRVSQMLLEDAAVSIGSDDVMESRKENIRTFSKTPTYSVHDLRISDTNDWKDAIESDKQTSSQFEFAKHGYTKEILGGAEGVTEYGTTNREEDLAEAIAIYMAARIRPSGDWRIGTTADGRNVSYGEMFPARFKLLNEIFDGKPEDTAEVNPPDLSGRPIITLDSPPQSTGRPTIPVSPTAGRPNIPSPSTRPIIKLTNASSLNSTSSVRDILKALENNMSAEDIAEATGMSLNFILDIIEKRNNRLGV